MLFDERLFIKKIKKSHSQKTHGKLTTPAFKIIFFVVLDTYRFFTN